MTDKPKHGYFDQDAKRQRELYESTEGEPLTVKAQQGREWKLEDSKGGDIVFQQVLPSVEYDMNVPLRIVAGRGWAPMGKVPLHGCIRFEIPGCEDFLRLEGDGRVFVRGQLERTDKALVDAFAEWVYNAIAHYNTAERTIT